MRKDLARRGIAFPFDRMYWIGCMEYKNIADQDVILDAVHRVDLAFLRNLPPPSPTADHLIVELLTGSDNTAMLVGQISPYELWDPDVIFALQRCTIDQCAGYLDQEQGKDMPPLPDDDPE